MQYAFVLGPVALTVCSCTCPEGDLEAGARVELRRVTPIPGNRDGNEGFQVQTVGDGGLWRVDLLVVVDPPTNEPRHHHHPQFSDGDVGCRVFDPILTADPPGWTMDKLADLRSLLIDVGASDLVDEIDYDDFARTLPAIRSAVETCLETGVREAR